MRTHLPIRQSPRSAWRRRIGCAVAAAAGVAMVGACEDDTPEPATTRDQLASATTFRASTGRSTAVLATTLTTPWDTYTRWVALPVAGGTMVATARGDTLSLEELEVKLAPVVLLDVVLEPDGPDIRDESRVVIALEDVAFRSLAPVTCTASWSEDGETGSCDGTTVFSLEWTLRIASARFELDPVLVGPLEMELFVDHVGDGYELASWGAAAGANWTMGPFSAEATLVFDLEARTPTPAPDRGIEWHEGLPPELIDPPGMTAIDAPGLGDNLDWHQDVPDPVIGAPVRLCGPGVECERPAPQNRL